MLLISGLNLIFPFYLHLVADQFVEEQLLVHFLRITFII